MQKLKDMAKPIIGRHNECREWWEGEGMMTCEQLDADCKLMCEDEEGADNYDVAGELINAYMSNHPMFGDDWNSLNVDARWVFIHDMHYGIDATIRHHMGMKLVYEDEIVFKETVHPPTCSYEDAMKVIK